MRDSDLGIVDGKHNPQLTGTEQDCLAELENRGKGRSAAVSAKDLAEAIGMDRTTTWPCRNMEWGTRNVRTLINHLIITHGIPIICKAGIGGGYFLPADKLEVAEFYRSFHQRAMTGLVKASRGQKAAFAEIVAQLSLGFDEPANKEILERLRLTPDDGEPPAWVQVVTKFLDRLAANPQEYASEIRRIQTDYGDIFVPREKVRLLKEKTVEFQKFLQGIS